MGGRGYCTLNHSPLFGADPDVVGVTHAAAAAGFDRLGIDVFTARALRDGPGWAPVQDALAATGLVVEELAGLNVGADDAAGDLQRILQMFLEGESTWPSGQLALVAITADLFTGIRG